MKKIIKNKKVLIPVLVLSVVLLGGIIINNSFGYKFKGEDSDNTSFKDNIYLTKSDCTNITGENVGDYTDYNGEEVLIDSTKTMFCKLEFGVPDSEKIVYNPSISHATKEDGSPCTDVQCALDGLYELYKGVN